MEKDQQLENILVAYALVLETPEEKFTPSLGAYSNAQMEIGGPTACGARFCFGGLIAQTPYFNKRNVRVERWHEYGLAPALRGCNTPANVSYELFGSSGLFEVRSVYEEGGSDKEVILRRLERAAAVLLEE